MDTYPSYVTTRTPRFEIVIEGKESDLLTGYVERIAEEAYESLAERYEFQPETPIRIEVYPSHGDFSVRTLGLPGLGALGRLLRAGHRRRLAVGAAQGPVQLGLDACGTSSPIPSRSARPITRCRGGYRKVFRSSKSGGPARAGATT